MNDTQVRIDTAREEAYWRAHFRNRPYVAADGIYDDYGPAFSYGVDACGRHDGRGFEEVEAELSTTGTDSRAAPRSAGSTRRARFATPGID